MLIGKEREGQRKKKGIKNLCLNIHTHITKTNHKKIK